MSSETVSGQSRSKFLSSMSVTAVVQLHRSPVPPADVSRAGRRGGTQPPQHLRHRRRENIYHETYSGIIFDPHTSKSISSKIKSDMLRSRELEHKIYATGQEVGVPPQIQMRLMLAKSAGLRAAKDAASLTAAVPGRSGRDRFRTVSV